MASDVQQSPFLKQLAASDRPTRDKAVDSLRTYLAGRRELDQLELLKLWKGLFYCVWMSDRAKTQQRLTVDLAGLVGVIPANNVMPFLEAFWMTMAREWNGIDLLRMDKFLLLARTYLGASFGILAKSHWQAEIVTQYTVILSSIPLNPTDPKVPDGLRYHVLDIYLDELEKVDGFEQDPSVVELLLRPIRTMVEKSPAKSVRRRAEETLSDARLVETVSSRNEAVDQVEEDEGWTGIDD
ncbi:MAG: hypothetical protein M1817_001577 [Caeruleum heppii]|nr:MAG: hypothetical protein M1817_001577 [Caeruleum heppii]